MNSVIVVGAYFQVFTKTADTSDGVWPTALPDIIEGQFGPLCAQFRKDFIDMLNGWQQNRHQTNDSAASLAAENKRQFGAELVSVVCNVFNKINQLVFPSTWHGVV